MLISERVSSFLSNKGSETVFMVTGGAAMFLNDSFTRNSDLKTTFFHHEQACAMAAEGYARISGRMPILSLTAGPGGINSLNGIFGAFNDSLPVFVVSGQVRTETLNRNKQLRQLGDQEAPIVDIVKSITKYSKTIDDPSQIDFELNKAYYLATKGRPGPVWLDIPINIQSEAYVLRNQVKTNDLKTVSNVGNKEIKFHQLYEKITKSKRPVIIAGSGIRLANQASEFYQFIEKFNIPVVTGFTGHDLMWESNPNYCGKAGTIGNRSGNLVVECSDLLIILGSRLNIRQIGYNFESFAKDKFACYIDIDKNELNKHTVKNIDLKINSDLQTFFNYFNSKKKYINLPEHKSFLSWAKKIHKKYGPDYEIFPQTKKINPYKFVKSISKSLNNTDVITFSNATAGVVPNQAIRLKKGQRFFGSSGSGSMGFGLPASIGASIGSKKRVICFEGDGSIQMNIQELATVSHNNLNIKIIIFSNNGYHSIRQTQRNYFSDNLVGIDSSNGLSFPDYKKISQAYGIPYLKISNESQVDKKLDQVLGKPGPIICEVMIDDKINYQPKVSSKRDSEGKIISAELYDMSPFISDEDLQMILDIKNQ